MSHISGSETPASTPVEQPAWTDTVKQAVDGHLRSFFACKRADAEALSGPSLRMVEVLEDFTMRGGKRTRPAVLMAGHAAVSDTPEQDTLLDACASLELLQSYLLAHDDWMDQDDERRGGPAVHRVFEADHRDAHLGATLAVLAGDLGNGYCIELLARSACSQPNASEIMEIFWGMQQDVVLGQQLDVIAHADVALIQRLKTGSYSVRGPLLLGAALGGASAEQRAALERYADPVGQAFQCCDDLLGTFGDPARTGKPAGNDLRQGKHTAIVEEARARLQGEQRAFMEALLGETDAPQREIEKLISILEECGARQAVEGRLDTLLEAAMQALDSAPLEPLGRDRLAALAERFARRDH